MSQVDAQRMERMENKIDKVVDNQLAMARDQAGMAADIRILKDQMGAVNCTLKEVKQAQDQCPARQREIARRENIRVLTKWSIILGAVAAMATVVGVAWQVFQ